jgi:hypothetical protein
MKRTFALATVILLASACGERARPGASGPDQPVTSSPTAPGPVPSPSPRLLEPESGLVEVRPHPWDTAEVLGPRTVQVSFYGGVEECYGLDRVEVRERPTRVVISVFTGRKPGAGVCIEIAELQAVRVTLDRPVGDRKIVDGNTGA